MHIGYFNDQRVWHHKELIIMAVTKNLAAILHPELGLLCWYSCQSGGLIVFSGRGKCRNKKYGKKQHGRSLLSTLEVTCMTPCM